jgi:hypothetical protein
MEPTASVTLGGAVYWISRSIHGPRREFNAVDVKRSKVEEKGERGQI